MYLISDDVDLAFLYSRIASPVLSTPSNCPTWTSTTSTYYIDIIDPKLLLGIRVELSSFGRLNTTHRMVHTYTDFKSPFS